MMKKKRNKKFILDRTEDLSKVDEIKKHLAYIKSKRFYLINQTVNKESVSKKYNVSICAIFKNEELYLKEWIEFNKIAGVEHFYLYNNNSTDNYLAVLAPYIEEGLVTLTQWPKNQAQIECYNTCIKNFKNESKWIGFIDIDEFVVPIDMENIYEFLKPFENKRGSVKIYWRMFGTSGLMNRDPNSLVTESFTVCWPKYYSVGKCFYNTSFDYDENYISNKLMHHELWTKYKGINMPPVNAFDKVAYGLINTVKSNQHPIQINHYFTKSYSEYALKKSKGDVFFINNPHDEEYFYLHEQENTATDYSAYKFLIKLKLAMKKETK